MLTRDVGLQHDVARVHDDGLLDIRLQSQAISQQRQCDHIKVHMMINLEQCFISQQIPS